jgi:hypothetical protein
MAVFSPHVEGTISKNGSRKISSATNFCDSFFGVWKFHEARGVTVHFVSKPELTFCIFSPGKKLIIRSEEEAVAITRGKLQYFGRALEMVQE